jgi:hypothetical protein
VLKIKENGYPWACEMLIKACSFDLKTVNVPIQTINTEKSGIKPLRDTLSWLLMFSRSTLSVAKNLLTVEAKKSSEKDGSKWLT